MWSKPLEVLNPYEALMADNDGKVDKKHNAKNITFTSGTNIYDFFILPTIRCNSDGYITFVTVEWLKWFVGFKRYKH